MFLIISDSIPIVVVEDNELVGQVHGVLVGGAGDLEGLEGRGDGHAGNLQDM